MKPGAALAAAACLLMNGCGSVIYKTHTIDDVSKPLILSVDAKQRFVFITPRDAPGDGSNSPLGSDGKGGPVHTRRIVCAEPSPDTMVGVAASLGLDIPLHVGSVQLGSSLAEAVAQIGNRTQTIALLRDGLYRACEAYMNATITEEEYKTMLHHYDMTMVMLVAIDGLTRSCSQVSSISGAAKGDAGAAAKTDPKAATPSADAAGTPATDAKKKDAAATDTPGTAADKTKTDPPAAGSPSASSSTNVNTSAIGTCPDSEKVAAEIRTMVKEFFIYKAPIHQLQCVATVMDKMQRTMPPARAGADPREYLELFAHAGRIAKDICSTQYFRVVHEQIEAAMPPPEPPRVQAPTPAPQPPPKATPPKAAPKPAAKNPPTADAPKTPGKDAPKAPEKAAPTKP